jgi:hypothetical protein
MSFSKLVVVAALSTCLTGCLQSATLVKVKPDGSGTIEQTLLANLQTMKGMMAKMGGGQMKDGGPGLMNEADFKRTAERMGVKPASAPGAAAQTGSSKTPLKFGFAKQGGSSVLTITLDEKQADEATAKVGAAAGSQQATDAAMDPAIMQMIKTMFQGFKVGVDLEVEGKIVKTNADYVNGSRITLLEVELAGLFEDEAKLKALQSKFGPGTTLSEIRPFLKDVKGVKINNPSLTIEYR